MACNELLNRTKILTEQSLLVHTHTPLYILLMRHFGVLLFFTSFKRSLWMYDRVLGERCDSSVAIVLIYETVAEINMGSLESCCAVK